MMEARQPYYFMKNAILRIRFYRLEDSYALLQILHALYHGYTIIEMSHDDYLLQSSGHSGIYPNMRLQISNPDLEHIISALGRNLFNEGDCRISLEEYHELVELIFANLSHMSYSSISFSICPIELSVLYRYLIEYYHCHSIYNPFAGLASIGAALHGLDIQYLGQEISHDIFHWAEFRLDACKIGRAFFRGDSITEWQRGSFDAIVSMLPWGMKLAGRYPEFESRSCHSFEDYYYWRAMKENRNARVIIGCSSNSFCTSLRSRETREMLCRKREIDTIIELPNILSSTMSPSILVVTPGERHDSIRFVKAKSALSKESRKKLLDVEVVIKMLEGSSDSVVDVNYEQIADASYVLSSEYYQVMPEDVEPGQKLVALKEIATFDRGEIVRYDSRPTTIIQQSDFSSDFYDICTTPKHIEPSIPDERIVYRKLRGQHIILSTRGGRGITIYWHRDNTDFLIQSGFPLKVDANRIHLEYLIYLLLSSKPLFDFVNGNSYGRSIERDYDYLLNYHMVIEPDLNKQRALVKTIINKEVQARQKVLDAIKARQNINTAAGDIVHMLGTPFLAQQNIIGRIQDYKGDKNAPAYTKNVDALIAASSYIQRIVNAMNADFATASFVKESIDLGVIVKNYINNIQISEIIKYPIEAISIPDDIFVKADTTMLQILLDSIIENASRHGFRKEQRKEYRISVSVEKVIFNEEPFALLSIKNNGYPMPKNFTLEDYVSKGRFNGESGRSGLGGYHVYSITKKHNGYIYLRSDEDWNFIIDILLPLTEKSGDGVYNTYDYEAI